MRHHEKTGAVRFIEAPHQFVNRLRGMTVEIASRLVSKHAGRLGDERPCNGCPFALATLQFTRRVRQTV